MSFETIPDAYLMKTILYDNHFFSIAWGDCRDGGPCVAMRWNRAASWYSGQQQPRLPASWFRIPDEVALSLMQGLLGKDSTEDDNVLAVLSVLLSRPFTT